MNYGYHATELTKVPKIYRLRTARPDSLFPVRMKLRICFYSCVCTITSPNIFPSYSSSVRASFWTVSI